MAGCIGGVCLPHTFHQGSLHALFLFGNQFAISNFGVSFSLYLSLTVWKEGKEKKRSERDYQSPLFTHFVSSSEVEMNERKIKLS